jgi:hypothetical protein
MSLGAMKHALHGANIAPHLKNLHLPGPHLHLSHDLHLTALENHHLLKKAKLAERSRAALVPKWASGRWGFVGEFTKNLMSIPLEFHRICILNNMYF